MAELPPAGFDPAIAHYYDQIPEESRLEQGAFRLEGVRTRELIERHAPPPPATVLDVGGAAGAYAFWLAERGYTVHLVDVVPRLVEEAQRRNGSAQRPLASCRVWWPTLLLISMTVAFFSHLMRIFCQLSRL